MLSAGPGADTELCEPWSDAAVDAVVGVIRGLSSLQVLQLHGSIPAEQRAQLNTAWVLTHGAQPTTDDSVTGCMQMSRLPR